MDTASGDPLVEIATHLHRALDGIAALRIGGRYDGKIDYGDLADRLRRLSLRRAELVPETQFFDPNWNILLDIYVAASRGRQLSVSAVCQDCGAPPTTALRYIAALVSDGLATRIQDHGDGRRFYVVITIIGRSAVERWLDAFVATFR